MSTPKSPKARATLLYFDLAAMYGSPHMDKQADIDNSIEVLTRVLTETEQNEEHLKAKMRELLSVGGMYKNKMSTLIENRFWRATYVQPIPFRPYKYS